jgi:hypothetical protein
MEGVVDVVEIKELEESGEWRVTSGEEEGASGPADSRQPIAESETKSLPAGCNARHENDGRAQI